MNSVFWLGAFVVFLAIEALTTTLISVWFAIGALVAAVGAHFGLGKTGCVIVFLVVSAITLTIFKRFYTKKMFVKHEPTNADRLIGEKGIVDMDINPITGEGTVNVKGRLWSAKAETAIEKGNVVEVQKIEGVKLVVNKV